MVPVGSFKHVEGHAEESGRRPLVDAALHGPRDRGMPEIVARAMLGAGLSECSPPRGLDGADTLPVTRERRGRRAHHHPHWSGAHDRAACASSLIGAESTTRRKESG